ncbi:MAG: hypothetical protein M5U19_21590 [Microthrixaceae bacterium]|nr:hypothetical protein [Microthrixaceae bacterium]
MLRLGLGGGAGFHDVGSPFDHRAAAMLYVPELLGSHAQRDRTPNHADWFDEAWAEAAGLIDAAEGRTLFLCTSIRNAREFAALARDRLDWPVLLQGELPKAKLLAEFAQDQHAIAFGTMGLWQGVDVAGPSLSCVIIDKLPFPRPDDPLWQARSDAARRRLLMAGAPESDAGYRAFLEVQVPRAASLLAQGAGRLIRRAGDRGLVAVLDPRLAEKAYRRQILDELPPCVAPEPDPTRSTTCVRPSRDRSQRCRSTVLACPPHARSAHTGPAWPGPGTTTRDSPG